MVFIVAGILSLMQHLISLKENSDDHSLGCCPDPNCGKLGLWCYGFRYRKADRENDQKSTLNPIPIQRLYCPTCHRTCSLLPECIPPFRWYLWLTQQSALTLFFLGVSFNKISQKITPSRWTVSRWVGRFIDQFETHALYLKSKWSWLGYKTTPHELWPTVFTQIELSHAMLFLHHQGVIIP